MVHEAEQSIVYSSTKLVVTLVGGQLLMYLQIKVVKLRQEDLELPGTSNIHFPLFQRPVFQVNC